MNVLPETAPIDGTIAANQLTHLDKQGLPRMVDVSGKDETLREAEAEARLWLGDEVVNKIRDGQTQKGNIFETARIGGIMGAKHTSDLIPLCPSVASHLRVGQHGDSR